MNANLARFTRGRMGLTRAALTPDAGKQWRMSSMTRVRGLQPRLFVALAIIGSWALALGAGHRWH